jgi:hypothetical protein
VRFDPPCNPEFYPDRKVLEDVLATHSIGGGEKAHHMRWVKRNRYRVFASTLARWAEWTGRDMLAFVDGEEHWRRKGYPEHVVKMLAYRMGLTHNEKKRLLKLCDKFFERLAKEFALDVREFCRLMAWDASGAARQEEARETAFAYLRALLWVRKLDPEVVVDLLREAMRVGPEVLLGEEEAAREGEAAR